MGAPPGVAGRCIKFTGASTPCPAGQTEAPGGACIDVKNTLSGTSTATTTKRAPDIPATAEAKVVIPDGTETTLTTDVYGMFVGGFLLVLSLVVLVSTGSILSVIVLWATIALIVTVLIYYGILSIDKLLGQEVKKVIPEVPLPAPSAGGPLVGSEVFHISDQQFT